jgi:hypothetical protein
MKTAWIKLGNRTFRIHDVQEASGAAMLDAGLSPTVAHLYIQGIPTGEKHLRLYQKQYLVKSSEHRAIDPPRDNSDAWYQAIQVTDTFPTESAADEALLALSHQEGFIAGRTIAPSRPKPGWRVQAFFKDEPGTNAASLPDGCRRVTVRNSMIEAFLLKE